MIIARIVARRWGSMIMTTNTAIEFLTALIELHKDHPHLLTAGDVEAIQAGIKAIKDLEIVERRLKHLLQSDFIRSFDEVNVSTKQYKRDISEAKQKKILYMCDRKKCGPNHDCFECNHTADVTHAVNFKRDILNDLYVENENVSHWILTMAVNGHGVYQCKKCRQGGRKFFKFCPNCGSKMIT